MNIFAINLCKLNFKMFSTNHLKLKTYLRNLNFNIEDLVFKNK